MARTTRSSRTKAAAWSFIAGEKGRNRVRVYERGAFGIYLDFRDEDGRRVRQPLGHGDRDQAKAQAEEIAARFRRQVARPALAVTLKTLIDTYE